MLGWFQPRCHAGILQFPKASFCPFGSAGFLSFCFTIFTKKCQSNCIQVRKLFPTSKFANGGFGDRPFFHQATNQEEKNQETTTCWGTFTASYEKPRCLLAELRGNLIQVKTLKIGRSAPCRTVAAVRCRPSIVEEKHVKPEDHWDLFQSIFLNLQRICLGSSLAAIAKLVGVDPCSLECLALMRECRHFGN